MSQNGAQTQMLNLAKMQLALDEIVFENIDTGHKWAHAQQLLENMYTESEQFFKQYVESKQGDLPKANSYWALFMDLMAKLSYFIAYTKQKQGSSEQQLAAAYLAAANYLPNSQHEGCIEFFEEIRTSYHEVSGEQLPETNYTIEQTIEHFSKAVLA